MLNGRSPRFTTPSPLRPFGNGHAKEPPAPQGDCRDGQGRFAKGWKGGPGNPFARRVAALRKTLFDAVSEDDLRAIAQKLVRRAKRGDVAAAKLLLTYLIGRPADTVNPDRLGLEELEFFKSLPTAGEYLEMLTDKIAVEPVCRILQEAIPWLTKEFFRQQAAGLRDQKVQGTGKR
jgi:hypothetical protein